MEKELEETGSPFARWLIIVSVSYLVGFTLLTRLISSDYNRILSESGMDKELRISYLVGLAVLTVGTIWSYRVYARNEIKILGVTTLILGVLLIPAVFFIKK